jgi:CHAT domain-containing protein
MIKFYQNLQNFQSVAIALNQAQLWLRDITKAELKVWTTVNSLPLDPTMRQNLSRRLHNLKDDQKPFQDPFYWAAFCAIGQ